MVAWKKRTCFFFFSFLPKCCDDKRAASNWMYGIVWCMENWINCNRDSHSENVKQYIKCWHNNTTTKFKSHTKTVHFKWNHEKKQTSRNVWTMIRYDLTQEQCNGRAFYIELHWIKSAEKKLLKNSIRTLKYINPISRRWLKASVSEWWQFARLFAITYFRKFAPKKKG